MALLLTGIFPGAGRAQVLARPGWAGSGVSTEVWWHTAVFYRLDPRRFQDSDGDGIGDLAGVEARLGYLRSLGIDALVLDGEFDSSGLNNLVRSASQQDLRVLVTVTPAMAAGNRKEWLSEVHEWLGDGIAGLVVPEGTVAAASYASLVADVSALMRMFPGERVLLAGPLVFGPAEGASAESASAEGASSGRHGRRAAFSNGHLGRLTTAAELPVNPPQAGALRQALLGLRSSNAGWPLLRLAESPVTAAPNAAGIAAILLTSRGAASFDFGDEIGLDTQPVGANPNAPGAPMAGRVTPTQDGPVMQWTPANIEEAAIPAPVERVPPITRPGETAFGPYRPYIRPPPQRLTGADPALPNVTVDGNIPPPLPAPNTLPGFTSGDLRVKPVDGERIDVATEDRDPHSLLNAYRQLIALHHGNATLRNGTQVVLNRDAEDAVVWVRRAPSGSRTAGEVLAAVNLSDHPVTLSLDEDLRTLGLRSGALRVLFSEAAQPLTGESTASLRVPAHGVFLGQLARP